jgi:hypothetical protein
MNTLVYADVTEEQTSNASSIASTMQQMSISFGVAAAGLAAALFIPDRFRSNPREMIHGVHEAYAQPIWQQPEPTKTWGIPSPDGRHLAMFGASVDSNVWMIDNF